MDFAVLCPSWLCAPVKPVGLHPAQRHNWAYQSWLTAISALSRLCFVLARETTLCSPPFPTCQLCKTHHWLSAIERTCCAVRFFPKEPSFLPYSHSTPLLPQAGLDRQCLLCGCWPQSQGHLIHTVSDFSKSQLTENH